MKTSKHVSITPYGKKGEKKARMTISKELTIYTIQEIRDIFLDAVDKYNELDIRITQVENIDLCFIQLIESLKKTAEEYGKKVFLSAELTDETKNLVENTGFDPILQT